MRRRRAGPTSPRLSTPSMSLTPTSGNVGQCEGGQNKDSPTIEKATNYHSAASSPDKWKRKNRDSQSNNFSSRSKSYEPSIYSAFRPYDPSYFLPSTSKHLYPTKSFSVPESLQSAVQQSSTDTNAAASAASAASAATAATHTTSVLSRPQLSTSTNDATSSSSSDDDVPAANNTIHHNARLPIPCLHTLSSTKSYKPKCFVGSPYRKTLLSLLCRVRTSPTDTYAATKPYADGLQVYACYQQHWYPKFNIPVLTLVACCNVNISQPILQRSEPDRFEVTFFCTTSRQQSKVTFKLPIFTSLSNIHNPLILKIGPNHPLPESLTSWLITNPDDNVTLTWIKVWHLSPVGCFNLHNHGLIIPQRPFPEAEVHFLGLTGKRKMPFRISQIAFSGTYLSMLDHIDIGNLGYKRYEIPKRPILPDDGTLIGVQYPMAFPRYQVHPNWYYEKGAIVRPTLKLRRWTHFEPNHYPPPFDYSLNLIEFPDPVVFQEGEAVFRTPLILCTTTLEDMITEAARKQPHEDPINTLMTYFNFKRQDIEAKYMSQPFTRFLRDKQTKETNGKCVFDSFTNGNNTGERYLVPKNWIPINRHPTLGFN